MATPTARQRLAELADTSVADVLPLVRGFVVSALESRDNCSLVDGDTDERITRIRITEHSGGRIEVHEDTHEGENPLLFILTVTFPED